MIFILKKTLDGLFLGYEITDFIDSTLFAVDKLYDNRIIINIKEEEHNDFECIVYTLTLSNDEVILN